MLGADVARAGPTGTRFGRECVGCGQLHVAFDGGQSDGNALGNHPRGKPLVDHGMDNAFAQIERIRFHPPRLHARLITLRGALKARATKTKSTKGTGLELRYPHRCVDVGRQERGQTR